MWLLTFDFWPGWSLIGWYQLRYLVVKFTFSPLCLWPPDLLSLSLLSLFAADVQRFYKVHPHFPSPARIRFCTRMTSHSNLFRPSLPTCLSVGIITGNWDGGMWGLGVHVGNSCLCSLSAVTATWALLFINGAVTSTFMAFQLLTYRGNKVSGRSALRTAAVQIKSDCVWFSVELFSRSSRCSFHLEVTCPEVDGLPSAGSTILSQNIDETFQVLSEP